MTAQATATGLEVRGTCPRCGFATEPRVYRQLRDAQNIPLPQPEYIPWVGHVHSSSAWCSDSDGRYWQDGSTAPCEGPVFDAAAALAAQGVRV